MKIKYLQVMHNAKIGDVREVTDFEANILVKTGVAKAFQEYLQNLNGTPVVDDFGALVLAGPIEEPVTVEPKAKTNAKKK